MYSSNMISALIMSCPGGAASGRRPGGVLPLPPLLIPPGLPLNLIFIVLINLTSPFDISDTYICVYITNMYITNLYTPTYLYVYCYNINFPTYTFSTYTLLKIFTLNKFLKIK